MSNEDADLAVEPTVPMVDDGQTAAADAGEEGYDAPIPFDDPEEEPVIGPDEGEEQAPEEASPDEQMGEQQEEGETQEESSETEGQSEEESKEEETEKTSEESEEEPAQEDADGEGEPGEEKSEEDVQLPEGLDEALSPLYKADPEKAQEIHEALNEQKELMSHGVPMNEITQFAENYKTIVDNVGYATRTRQALELADEYRKSGNIDQMAKTLNLNPDTLEEYYVAKRQAKEEGVLPEFEAKYSQNEKQVQLAMENRHLREQIQEQDTRSSQQEGRYWHDRIRQNPVMVEANKIFENQEFAHQTLQRVWSTLPDDQRTMENAFKATVKELQGHVNRFGGRAQAPAKTSSPAPKGGSKRPAALKPPSKNSSGKSVVNRRKTPETIEDLLA